MKQPMTVAEAGRIGGLKGGKAKSAAKTKAARQNAKKGAGRPNKQSTKNA